MFKSKWVALLPCLVTSVVTSMVTLVTLPAHADSMRSRTWEYQGVASTGEEIYLNPYSIRADSRGRGYFFYYRIGNEYVSAFTHCDGRFQVAESDGVTFGEMMEPQSEATRSMLQEVCTRHLRR
jgi:hypothetical protein